VVGVEETNDEGTLFNITYDQGNGQTTTQTVELPNPAKGATKEERVQDVKERAGELQDWSVEQLFLSSEPSDEGKSRFFTVRTAEKAPDLVQIVLDRLLTDAAGKPLLKRINLTDFKVQRQKATLSFSDYASPGYVKTLLDREFRNYGKAFANTQPFDLQGKNKAKDGHYKEMEVTLTDSAWLALKDNGKATDEAGAKEFTSILKKFKTEFDARPPAERLENFDTQLAAETQSRAIYAILASWAAILLYLWFRFGNWTFGLATVICLIHDLFFTLGLIAFSHYIHLWFPGLATTLGMQDFKIDLPAIAALLTLVGYSVNDTIVVFDRIREVRGKNPELTPQMINDSVNQTLSRTLLTAFSVWLVVIVLYIWGGEGVHLFAFVMVVGVIVGTYSSIYIASPLLLIFGEGGKPARVREKKPEPEPEPEEATT
jgi:SecD/SecF fusion protein